MELDTLVRLAAHTMTIGLLLASLTSLMLAQGKPLHWHYWRWLAATLYIYTMWFTLLLVTVKHAALFPRAELTMVLGAMELSAAVVGWVWWVRTARASFHIAPRKPRGVGVQA